jgi:glycosyltransferase involved in cell wall biosynthesis
VTASLHGTNRATSGRPTFGVVIPTYNEERNLERLLRSFRLQTNDSYSIVVVDQGSTDRTVEIARSYGCSVIAVPRPLFYSPPARSRNVGAESIVASILVHLDADMELDSPDFLLRLKALFDDEHQAAVIHERDVAYGFWATCKSVERSCYFDTEMEAARAVTTELFARVGGYDEDISSGEDFFITRAFAQQTKVARDRSVVLLHHVGHLSLRAMLRKKFSYGRTAHTYLVKAHSAGAQSARSVAWTSLRAYLRNWKVVRKHPAAYLCVLPLRAMELGAVLLGMWAGTGSVRQPRRNDDANSPQHAAGKR